MSVALGPSRTIYSGSRYVCSSCLQKVFIQHSLPSFARRSRAFSAEPSARLQTGDADALERHEEEVSRVAARVKHFYNRKEKFRIYHGSTNSTRKHALGRDPRTVVDTSRLNHVVSIDRQAQAALVEPNVPMDRLVEATLEHGLVPPVVMEFPGITVGGGYSGTAGESSSFKHGFFDRTLNRVEMVLADGQRINSSAHENQDLFHGAAGALGTLGVTTLVELRLRRATKFVQATYHPVTSVRQAISVLQDFTSRPDDFDYIDGIMFSHTNGAIITGIMTDTPSDINTPIQRFSAPSDPWFYLHIQSLLSSRPSNPITESIPLPDYLFRYDRGGFWVGSAPFDYFHFPFNTYTRAWLDDFLHTRMLYTALHASGRSSQMIIQDLALPFGTSEEFIASMDWLTGIWPLWLCPLKQSPRPTMHPHLSPSSSSALSQPSRRTSSNDDLMLNIGLWGPSPARTEESYISLNRQIESTLRKCGGMKWLYAQTFDADEASFWSDFDKGWYESLRKKYSASTLPMVWDKVKWAQESRARPGADGMGESLMALWRDVWPLPGVRGLVTSIESKDYVAARNAAWRNWVPRT